MSWYQEQWQEIYASIISNLDMNEQQQLECESVLHQKWPLNSYLGVVASNLESTIPEYFASFIHRISRLNRYRPRGSAAAVVFMQGMRVEDFPELAGALNLTDEQQQEVLEYMLTSFIEQPQGPPLNSGQLSYEGPSVARLQSFTKILSGNIDTFVGALGPIRLTTVDTDQIWPAEATLPAEIRSNLEWLRPINPNWLRSIGYFDLYPYSYPTLCPFCQGSEHLYCEECTEGGYDCGECDGSSSWACDYCDAGDVNCDDCDGEGEIDCQECEEGKVLEPCPICVAAPQPNPGWVAVPCEECSASGYVPCDDCEGKGEGIFTCPSCKGEGEIPCGTCDDIDAEDGYVWEACTECTDGEVEVDCVECDGVGQEPCPNCVGEGTHSCQDCDGYGTVQCDSCENGWIECADCGGNYEWGPCGLCSTLKKMSTEIIGTPWTNYRQYFKYIMNRVEGANLSRTRVIEPYFADSLQTELGSVAELILGSTINPQLFTWGELWEKIYSVLNQSSSQEFIFFWPTKDAIALIHISPKYAKTSIKKPVPFRWSDSTKPKKPEEVIESIAGFTVIDFPIWNDLMLDSGDGSFGKRISGRQVFAKPDLTDVVGDSEFSSQMPNPARRLITHKFEKRFEVPSMEAQYYYWFLNNLENYSSSLKTTYNERPISKSFQFLVLELSPSIIGFNFPKG